jgi:hypothetical protein
LAQSLPGKNQTRAGTVLAKHKNKSIHMKKNLSLLGVLAVLLSAGAAFAQGSGNGTNDCVTNFYSFNHSYSNHYYYTNSGPWWSDMSRWTNAGVPRAWTNTHRVVVRGERRGQGGPPTPADVQALVQKFQADRETFMGRQRDLKRQMDSASEQQRQQLRDQLRDQMRDYQRQQTRVREQLSQQADRLREQLRDHERLIDRVSNPGTVPAPGGSGSSGSATRGR